MGRGTYNARRNALGNRLEQLNTLRQRAAECAEQLRAAGLDGEWWTKEITPDHPLAKALGHDQAVAFAAKLARPAADRCPSGLTRAARQSRALRRRQQVLALTKAGRPVAEIAAELGLSYGYVVQLRSQLGIGRQR